MLNFDEKMAKFYNITGYYAGYDKTPHTFTLNIDHIIRIWEGKENKNITYIDLTNKEVLIVGQPIKDVIKAFTE